MRKWITEMNKELSNRQIERQDFVDARIIWMLNELFEEIQPHNQQGSVYWNIEDIGKVRDAIFSVLEPLGVNEMDFYPYLEE